MPLFSMQDLRDQAAKLGVTGSDEDILREYSSRTGIPVVQAANMLGYNPTSSLTDARLSASMRHYGGNIAGLAGEVFNSDYLRGVGSDWKTAGNVQSARAQAFGGIDSYKDVDWLSPSSIANYAGGLAAQSLPYAAEVAAGGLLTRAASGGLRLAGGLSKELGMAGAERAAARELAVRSTIGGAAASYPSSMADIVSNQQEENGQVDLLSAAALAVPYAAANAMGFEGALARGTLFRNTVGRLDDLRGVGGLAARTAATGAKTYVSEGAQEVFQEGMNQLGRMAVNPEQTLFGGDAPDRYAESFVGGGLLGGLAGSLGGGWRRSENWQPPAPPVPPQVVPREPTDLLGNPIPPRLGWNRQFHGEDMVVLPNGVAVTKAEFDAFPVAVQSYLTALGVPRTRPYGLAPQLGPEPAANTVYAYGPPTQQGLPLPGIMNVNLYGQVGASPQQNAVLLGQGSDVQPEASEVGRQNAELLATGQPLPPQYVSDKPPKPPKPTETTGTAPVSKRQARRQARQEKKKEGMSLALERLEVMQAAGVISPEEHQLYSNDLAQSPPSTKGKHYANIARLFQERMKGASRAAQKPSAAGVDARQQAGNGQAVGEGNAKGQAPAASQQATQAQAAQPVAASEQPNARGTSPVAPGPAGTGGTQPAGSPGNLGLLVGQPTGTTGTAAAPAVSSAATQPVGAGETGRGAPAIANDPEYAETKSSWDSEVANTPYKGLKFDDLHPDAQRMVLDADVLPGWRGGKPRQVMDMAVELHAQRTTADKAAAAEKKAAAEKLDVEATLDKIRTRYSRSPQMKQAILYRMGIDLQGHTIGDPLGPVEAAAKAGYKSHAALSRAMNDLGITDEHIARLHGTAATLPDTDEKEDRAPVEEDGEAAGNQGDINANVDSDKTNLPGQKWWMRVSQKGLDNLTPYELGIVAAKAVEYARDETSKNTFDAISAAIKQRMKGKEGTPFTADFNRGMSRYSEADPTVRTAMTAKLGTAAQTEEGKTHTVRRVKKDEGTGGIQKTVTEKRGGAKHTAPSLRVALRRFLRARAIGQQVVIVESVDDLTDLRDLVGWYTHTESGDRAAAWVRDGVAYLVPSRMTVGAEKGVILHEIGSHLGLQRILDPATFNRLASQIFRWAHKNDGSIESRLAVRAIARAKAAGEAASRSEHIAYFVEEAVNAGIDPTAAGAKTPIRQWLSDLWGAFKKILDKFGIRPEALTAQDVVDLAYAAAQAVLRGPIDTTKSPEQRSAVARPFYSALESEVSSAKMKVGTPNSWKQLLTSWVNSGKVKPDEIKWSGIMEYLDVMQDAKGLTKEDILNHLKYSNIVVGVTEKGSIGKQRNDIFSVRKRLQEVEWKLSRAPEGVSYRQSNVARGRSERDRLIQERASLTQWLEDHTPKWAGFRQGLASPYAEIVIHLDREPSLPRTFRKQLDAIKEGLLARHPGARGRVLALMSSRYREPNEVFRATLHALTEAIPPETLTMEDLGLLDDLQQLIDKVRKHHGKFPGPHFPGDMVLAHVRVSEIPAEFSGGVKTMVVEELQSDWAQQGRKLGFLRDLTQAEQELETKYQEFEIRIQDLARKWGSRADLEENRRVMQGTLSRLRGDLRARLSAVQESLARWRETHPFVNGQFDHRQNVTDFELKEDYERLATTRRELEYFLEEAKYTSGKLALSEEDRFDYEQTLLSIQALATEASMLPHRPVVGNVGNAPYVNTTDKWVTLALKRVVTFAIEHGFERVLFPNGHQIINMFGRALPQEVTWQDITHPLNLGHGRKIQVTLVPPKFENYPQQDPMTVIVNAKGMIIESVDAGASSQWQTQGRHISDLIGGVMARKVMDEPFGWEWPESIGNYSDYLDKWPLTFYGEIVPKLLKQLLKGTTAADTIREDHQLDPRLNLERKTSTDPEGMPFHHMQDNRRDNYTLARDPDSGQYFKEIPVDQYGRLQGEVLTQLGFDITPDLVDRVAGGYTQFTYTNNASGESAASAEAQSRRNQERALDRPRILVDRYGKARVLSDITAADHKPQAGEIILQKGVGRNTWTIMSEGAGVTPYMRGRALSAANKPGAQFSMGSKEGEIKGELKADKGNLIQLLGANMYAANVADVAVKELLQNAFDAVKGAVLSGIYKTGDIKIAIDWRARTIEVTDNAKGMTPKIVQNAFFTIAGSDKSDLPPDQRSGGLGLAKLGFMLGAKSIHLDTVRDGTRVVVDATAAQIGNDDFVLKTSPAPLSEHGTVVRIVVPENYTDPKTGDKKDIWMPTDKGIVTALSKPLVGPVRIHMRMNSPLETYDGFLPMGVNFDTKKNPLVDTVQFDWGSADIYFGDDRDEYGSHDILSSGIYQFSQTFKLSMTERIPHRIVVNVKPNVDARHPDYPFENSRERFKGRLKQDIEKLEQYLRLVARGIEAAGMKDSFTNVVSLPRTDPNQEAADTAEKLRKAFDKPSPEEVLKERESLSPTGGPARVIKIVGNAVVDATTGETLFVLPPSDEDKPSDREKEASFKSGKAAPDIKEFMLEIPHDPTQPLFHSNVSSDLLAVGEDYGNPRQFMAELGSLFVELKEELARAADSNLSMKRYSALSASNLFFAGISIDKSYGGVYIKVPYKAVYINPFYSFGARTLNGVRTTLLESMVHELAHQATMSHGVEHNNASDYIYVYLADQGRLEYYRESLKAILEKHESTFTAMKDEYERSTVKNVAKSLGSDEKTGALRRAAGPSEAGTQGTTGAVHTGGRQADGGHVPASGGSGGRGPVNGGSAAYGGPVGEPLGRVEQYIRSLPVPVRAPLRALTMAVRKVLRGAPLNLVVFTDSLINRAVHLGIQAARTYQNLYQQRIKLMTEIEDEVRRIGAGYANVPPDEKGTGEGSVSLFLYDSTRSERWGFKPDWLPSGKSVTPDAKLEARFNALSPQSQQLIKDVFRHGHLMLEKKRAAVLQALDSEYDILLQSAKDAKDEEEVKRLEEQKQKLVERFSRLFDMSPTTPYAPIKRFGQWVVMAKSDAYLEAERNADSKAMAKLERNADDYYVDFFESEADALDAENALKASGKYSTDPEGVLYRQKEEVRSRLYGGDGMQAAFTKMRAQVRMRLEGAKLDKDKQAASVAYKMLDLANELYLTAMAEGSARKSEIRRRGIAGNIDMLRSFETQGISDAHMIAAMEFAGKQHDAINKMRQEVRTGGTTQQLPRSEVFNEIVARFLQSMDYQPTPVADAMQRLGTLWYLAFSPAYYLQNLTQPWMLSLPVMVKDHGATEIGAELLKGYRELTKIVSAGRFDYSLLPADVRAAVVELANRNLINLGLTSEMGAIRASDANWVGRKWNNVNHMIDGLMRRVEAINRAATAIAAYRLNFAKTGDTNKAIAYADEIVRSTHGDYSRMNAPRAFNTGVGKVMLQFRKFQLIQLTMLAKMLRDSVSGDNQWAARKSLAWLLLQTGVLAGVTGLPGYAAISWLLVTLFGDEDDPDDAEYKMRKWIGDSDVADIILRGLPNKLTGVNIGGKLGMGNALSVTGPFTNIDLTDRTAVESLGYAILGGPAGGLAPRAADALGELTNGRYYKGLERMLPNGLSSAMKGIRLGTEGLTNKGGDTLLSADEVSFAEAAAQSIGLQPTSIQKQQWRAGVAYDYEKKLDARTANIKREYADARNRNDSEAAADAREDWDRLQEARVRNGLSKQPLSELMKAVSERSKQERGTVGGVQWTPVDRRFKESLANM